LGNPPRSEERKFKKEMAIDVLPSGRGHMSSSGDQGGERGEKRTVKRIGKGRTTTNTREIFSRVEITVSVRVAGPNAKVPKSKFGSSRISANFAEGASGSDS